MSQLLGMWRDVPLAPGIAFDRRAGFGRHGRIRRLLDLRLPLGFLVFSYSYFILLFLCILYVFLSFNF